MITTREFFETDANCIIEDLQTYWGIQKSGEVKYVNVPFPSKEEFLEQYESGLDSPYEELSDIDTISSIEEQQMIDEQKSRISETYDRIKEIRDKFNGVGHA